MIAHAALAVLTGVWRMTDGQAHQFYMYHDEARREITFAVRVPPGEFAAGTTLRAGADGVFRGDSAQRITPGGCEEHYLGEFRPVGDRLHVTVTAPAAPVCGLPKDYRLEYDLVRSAP